MQAILLPAEDTSMQRMSTEHLKRCERIAQQQDTKEGRELAAAIAAALERRAK